jgi:hypothetical protein
MNERLKELVRQHIPEPHISVKRTELGHHYAEVIYTVSKEDMEILLDAVVQDCINNIETDVAEHTQLMNRLMK